jgi:hypothetical protein
MKLVYYMILILQFQNMQWYGFFKIIIMEILKEEDYGKLKIYLSTINFWMHFIL